MHRPVLGLCPVHTQRPSSGYRVTVLYCAFHPRQKASPWQAWLLSVCDPACGGSPSYTKSHRGCVLAWVTYQSKITKDWRTQNKVTGMSPLPKSRCTKNVPLALRSRKAYHRSGSCVTSHSASEALPRASEALPRAGPACCGGISGVLPAGLPACLRGGLLRVRRLTLSVSTHAVDYGNTGSTP